MAPGRRLRKWREGEGMSQAGLAERLHVHQSRVSRWEAGDSVPDLSQAIALARLAKIRVEDWLTSTKKVA
jgi:transcriptional regulator with XRE-family HTH domain